jgi:hypothetical protein
MTAPADPVKLFVATLHAGTLSEPKSRLEERLGSLDYESPIYPFDCTDYYAAEMGTGLSRILCSFERLISPGDIADVKLFTNQVERDLAIDGKRVVNLDPGYLDYTKVVLASTKFGGQKVYLRDGIYADIVLLYEKSAFKPFAWVFPDFKSGRYDAALLEIRRRYHAQRQATFS